MPITRKIHWLYFKEAGEFFALITEKVNNSVRWNMLPEKYSGRGLVVVTLANRKVRN